LLRHPRPGRPRALACLAADPRTRRRQWFMPRPGPPRAPDLPSTRRRQRAGVCVHRSVRQAQAGVSRLCAHPVRGLALRLCLLSFRVPNSNSLVRRLLLLVENVLVSVQSLPVSFPHELRYSPFREDDHTHNSQWTTVLAGFRRARASVETNCRFA
jgi:hypothetical protein